MPVVHFAQAWPHRGQLFITGECRVVDKDAQVHTRYDPGRVPSIKVSAARPAKQIAGEIARRLLPDYLALWDKLASEANWSSNHDAKMRATLAQAGAVIGSKPDPTQEHAQSLKACAGDVRVTMNAHDDGIVNLDIRCLPVGKLQALWTALT